MFWVDLENFLSFPNQETDFCILDNDSRILVFDQIDFSLQNSRIPDSDQKGSLDPPSVTTVLCKTLDPPPPFFIVSYLYFLVLKSSNDKNVNIFQTMCHFRLFIF